MDCHHWSPRLSEVAHATSRTGVCGNTSISGTLLRGASRELSRTNQQTYKSRALQPGKQSARKESSLASRLRAQRSSACSALSFLIPFTLSNFIQNQHLMVSIPPLHSP